MPVDDGVGRTTRDYLRAGTAQSHDRLDKKLGALVGNDQRSYALFLDIQYRARVGIEEWIGAVGVNAMPPHQSRAIAQDLAALGWMVTAKAPVFSPPPEADPLGVCWVLAGASLGNRAILARVQRQDSFLPRAFLSDERMTRYWRFLRPVLERAHRGDCDRALLIGAKATFDHFNAVVADSLSLEAA